MSAPTSNWLVLVHRHYTGNVEILHYRDKSKARAAYRKLRKALDDSINFRNDREKVAEVDDIQGSHSFKMQAVESVRVICNDGTVVPRLGGHPAEPDADSPSEASAGNRATDDQSTSTSESEGGR